MRAAWLSCGAPTQTLFRYGSPPLASRACRADDALHSLVRPFRGLKVVRYHRARLLIFLKAPVAGRVKTRLIPVIGALNAARLYERMAVRTVSKMARAGLCPIDCWCSPQTRHPFFSKLAGNYRVVLHRQAQGDLGRRMRVAAECALGRADHVVLMGGDCPLLGPRHVARALSRLEAGVDLVMGAAEDGGYVLLGLRRAWRELFEDMPWGSGDVADITRQRAVDLGLRTEELPTLWDVDRAADVRRLRRQPGWFITGSVR